MDYGAISKLYPGKIRKNYLRLLSYFDLKVKKEYVLGFIIFSGLAVSLIIALQLARIYDVSLFLMFVASFIVIEFLVHTLITLAAERKAKFVEDVLPDALQLMASNLRAGLTPDKAFLVSARPEFGILNEEINRIGKEITAGTDMEHALKKLARRVKSEVLGKTVDLIVLGLRSGGEFSSLLDQTADNLKQQKLVRNKVNSNILMYVIFIFSAIAFGSPILFGFSSFLIQVLVKNLGSVGSMTGDIASQASLPIQITGVAISPDFVILFIVVSLITSSILGSFVLGAISKGKGREGLNYIPILVALSLGLFFIVRFIITNAFGGLMSF
ncbi:type II secretion system F family protein [Candidatus Woesearchaeota archaeon]|nr:type II secretion system F family protein [Candidatus Woesearchaeota archaeon]